MRTLSTEEITAVSGAVSSTDPLLDRIWSKLFPKSYYSFMGFFLSVFGG